MTKHKKLILQKTANEIMLELNQEDFYKRRMRLIMAAPELLEACKQARSRLLTFETDESDIITLLNQAISEAK